MAMILVIQYIPDYCGVYTKIKKISFSITHPSILVETKGK